ncbi:hypothetical protein LOD99_2413 [Oopsacas minuta]|uniref:Uncharacterized protein n=1 Tax=Oopsacas minuta TaxID=111878 RepID=A0AAV7K1I4_9METZ|nr:hypothetical protein LOD99_2413 [Oopsacas minuta]
MDRLDVMSNHSAPYTQSLGLLPQLPSREYTRERSYTLPRTTYKNKRDKLVSFIPLDNNQQKTRLNSLSFSSIDEIIQETETVDEKWEKLKEMIAEVENMKSVVDKLFPAVEVAEYSDTPIDYQDVYKRLVVVSTRLK